jgi:hypothetical protein
MKNDNKLIGFSRPSVVVLSLISRASAKNDNKNINQIKIKKTKTALKIKIKKMITNCAKLIEFFPAAPLNLITLYR